MKKRVVYLDILNIIAIISVVALHCNAIVHGNPMNRAWNTSLIVKCLCYFAVPLFFMISGSNLMKYREKYDTKTFYKKRVIKVLIPFLFWATFMFIWKIFITKTISLESVNSITEIINAFFSNKEESTYYFMFEILGVYMIMPLLSLLAKKEYHKTLWFIVILFFVFNGLIPNFLLIADIKWYNGLGLPISGYMMYAILGYLLSNTDLSKKQKNMIFIGAVLGLIYRYTLTFIWSKEAGYVVKTIWGYSSWHCILLASSIFILIKNLKINNKIEKNKTLMQWITKISSCSFGIFLIHLIVKYYIVLFLQINTASWVFRTFGIVAVYIVSLIIVLILKKVPIIKRIVP